MVTSSFFLLGTSIGQCYFSSSMTILPWNSAGGYWGAYPAGEYGSERGGGSICMPAIQGGVHTY